MVFRAYSPTVTNIRFTYEQSCTTPGTLVSDRWNFEFVYTGLYVLLILSITTFGFMIAQWKIYAPKLAHLIIASLMLIWMAVLLLGFFIPYWVTANNADQPPTINPASDPRWCGAYYNQPSALTVCSNAPATPYIPNIVPADLGINNDFLFLFFFHLGLTVMLILDLVLSFIFVNYVSKEKKRNLPIEKRIRSRN